MRERASAWARERVVEGVRGREPPPHLTPPRAIATHRLLSATRHPQPQCLPFWLIFVPWARLHGFRCTWTAKPNDDVWQRGDRMTSSGRTRQSGRTEGLSRERGERSEVVSCSSNQTRGRWHRPVWSAHVVAAFRKEAGQAPRAKRKGGSWQLPGAATARHRKHQTQTPERGHHNPHGTRLRGLPHAFRCFHAAWCPRRCPSGASRSALCVC